jgi:hypothetical protein
MSEVPEPEWIDWSKINKNGLPYYRKITNIIGGTPGSTDLQWLSYFNTQPSGVQGPNDIVSGPVYEKNPKYVWFLDEQAKKLKISEANNPITYTLDPRQDCYDDKSGKNCKKDCCSTSSSLDKCVYSWYQQSISGIGKTSCGVGEKTFWNPNHPNQWMGPTNTTCDHWSYFSYDQYINNPTKQNIGGTFCNNVYNRGQHMRTFLGCDCAKAGGGQSCANMSANSNIKCDNEDHADDPKIAYSTYPIAERAQWQFIDDTTAFSCCCQDPKLVESGQYPQCLGQFNPSGGNASKCPQITQEYCSGHWGDGTEIGRQCQQFLGNSNANTSTVQLTLQNYITSRIPQDYISYNLWQSGDQASSDYYEKNICFKDYESNGCDISNYDPNENPCCRDDSLDPFFSHTVPYLCGYQYNSQTPPQNSLDGVCDSQLQYFCQSFTRDQLAADLTLQNICGCNLISNTSYNPINPKISNANSIQMDLDRCSDNFSQTPICQKPDVSPYYVNANTVGDNCDIICNTALVQSKTLGGKCTQQVCMIDNVTINQLNSKTGDTTITQSCDGGKCYIVDVDINEINSTTGGNNITQNCSSCYYTNSNDLLTAQPVDCGTLTPITPTKDEDGKSTSKSIFNKLFDGNIIVLLIFLVIIIVIIGFFIASYYNKKYEKKIETLVPPEGVIFGDDYWESY